LSAHKHVVIDSGCSAVLHGHPKFSVILSMDCSKKDCEQKGSCHIRCPYKRFINDIPIVPGEVGKGPYGLFKTVPEAIKNNRGVIVYGHGVFTTGKIDFTEAFKNLYKIENECIKEYFNRVDTI
jgi:ribulose-5-phosphate 4-epimerase/fuculose-1-phosphate aldolase